jgi:acyl-CoA synthetase (AMP-forming)/AMP-acid ligase II
MALKQEMASTPTSASSNIARHLPAMASQQPGTAAIKIPRGRRATGEIDYLCLSFAELATEAATWKEKLEKAGLRRGDRTLVMVRPGLPLIAAVFALFALGAVPIVIDPGMGLKNFLACVKRSRPRALVGIPMARVISRLAPWAFRGLELRIAAESRLDASLSATGAPARELQTADCHADELAAILFTSGSTGAPKGVCYEHGMFEAQVAMIREAYDIRPGEIDLPLLPIFALFNPALGMTTIVPEIDPRRPASLNPAHIVQAIRQERVTNSFGSPTLWRLIGDHCLHENIQLDQMRRILCAGAPVPASLWADSPRFLPNGLLHSPYGATECLPVSSISSVNVDARTLLGTPVGKPLPGMDVRVIAIEDRPLSDISQATFLDCRQIGEIIVRGPVTTKVYDALPEATASAKIPDASGGLWHRMGDTGFLDSDGNLWFCGRKAERVVTPGTTYFTEPCERVFRRHPAAARCALVGLAGADGQLHPAIVVEARPSGKADAHRLAAELRKLGAGEPQARDIRTFLFHPSFPVDVRHNAKIHRLTLARWAAKAERYEVD